MQKDVDKFIGQLEEILHITQGEAIIVGDINLNIGEQRRRERERYLNHYLNTLENYSFRILNKLPTRVTETKSSTIDHIISNMTNKTKITVYNIDNGYSDHNMLVINIKNTKKPKTKDTNWQNKTK